MHRCLRTKSAFAALLLLGFSLPLGSFTRAADKSLESSTSAEAKAEAAAAIPFKRIDPEYRPAVRAVLDDVSVFRRLPTQVVDCDPAMFTFMAQNPEVLVEIWRELKITQVRLQRIDEKSFSMADGAGTTGKLTIVEQMCEDRAQNRIVMFAEGGYEGKPFTKPVKAQCVLLLRSGSMVEHDGRNFVAVRLDSFIHIDRASLEIFAKVVHPLVGKTADRNFGDTITFIGNFSQAAELQPARIERLATSLAAVNPSRQQQLVKIAYDCGENARTLQANHTAALPRQETTKQ
jgi:hypothetical protein